MKREHWSSKFGFFFAAVGSAVGLGVLWKFPYTVGQNGGGLFLLMYILCTLLIGIPVFIAELMIGRRSQRASVCAFTELCQGRTSWKVGGWFGVISSFLIMSFYSVIAGYGMSYILMSLTGMYQRYSTQEIGDVYNTLAHSGSISVLWHFLFTLITMLIVLSGVRKGIEYWSGIMTRALFVLLIGMFLYSITLPGFGKAVEFIFYPDFENFNYSSALEALGLAFFTLSLGQGIMISYGSYLQETSDIPKMAVVVAFSVIFVAILSSMTIFPVVFSFDLPPNAGTGMVFKTLPYLFAQLPGSLVLSTLFFTLFTFTALTSSIPFIEVVATNLMELLHWKRTKAVTLTALSTFLFGIPCALSASGGLFPDWPLVYKQTFMQTIEGLVFVWIVPITGFITALFVGWVVDRNISFEEFTAGEAKRGLWNVWHFFMRWVIPAVILLIILEKSKLLVH